MVELELLGLHSDGEHLTLAGPDGQHYRLRVDDALRAAVRRDRPQLEQLKAAGTSLRPKEIQARIRAGASAQDVAEEAGLPVEHVRRYEGPVIAERTWVVEQARRFAIGRAEGAPTLGDLVVDRLAARGVPPAELEWDAVRRPGASWQVVVRFLAGGRPREARWEVDLASRAAHALDDESRWLSETDLGASAAARRHLAPVRLHDPDAELGAAIAAVDAGLSHRAEPRTEELLDELTASRGTRQEVDLAVDEDLLDSLDLPPAAHPPASRAHEASDAHVLALPPRPPGEPRRGSERSAVADAHLEGSALHWTEEEAGAARPPARDPHPAARPAEHDRADREGPVPARPVDRDPVRERPEPDPSATRARGRSARAKGRRTSVPSWDEIVFGAKPE